MKFGWGRGGPRLPDFRPALPQKASLCIGYMIAAGNHSRARVVSNSLRRTRDLSGLFGVFVKW
jgi:hypothetical protein